MGQPWAWARPVRVLSRRSGAGAYHGARPGIRWQAGEGALTARHNTGQRRTVVVFPAPVRPEEPEHLAVADLKRDVSNATRSPKRLLRLWTDNAVAPWLAPDAALCMLCRLRARLRAASWSRAAVVAGASAAGMVLLRVFMVSPFFGY